MLDTLAPIAVPILDEGFDDITVVFGILEMYRKRLHTSYSIERLNEEIRRRKRVIRIFTNEESITQLIGSLLLEQHEKWISGKPYFSMETYEIEKMGLERQPLK